METRAKKQEMKMSAVNKVFRLDVLREMILDYVIHDGKEVAIRDVRSCRLVSKTWLNSTSRILMRSKEPLFRFGLSLQPIKKFIPCYHLSVNEKPFRQFLKLGAKGRIMGDQMPPHSIKVPPVYSSIQEPCQTLSDALMISGSSVVELDFDVTGIWPAIPLNILVRLPRLQTFAVRFCCISAHSDGDFDGNIMDLIQSVFAATEQLKAFKFRTILDLVPTETWTNRFGNLRLPPSITELHISGCTLNDNILEVLAKNDLPILKTLTFCVNKAPYKDGLISSILEKVRKTLQNLCVQDVSLFRSGGTQGPTTCRFPLMEKLGNLSIETKNLELEKGCSSLQRLVPLLKNVTLRYQPILSFRNWIEKLSVDSVKSLTVTMPAGLHDNLDLSTLATISRVYPNLQELEFTFWGVEMEGLKFIFSEMINLRCLRIFVNVHQDVKNSDPWDTLLTGFQKEELASLKNFPELWEDFQVGNNSSIRNLTELQTLKLETRFWDGFSFISDDVFNFAFFKMPKLKNLAFKGSFSATPEMEKRWREEGRVINYRSH